MANTVTNISYANTFGEWVAATNVLIGENNTLGKGNYTKDSGTLTLSESTLVALSSLGDIVANKQLRSEGAGSSTTVQNNLTVGGQIYFTNSVLGLTHTGQANMNGLVVVQGPNIGITVANNAYVGGNTTIRYNTVTDKVVANTSVTTPLVSSTTVNNSGTAYTGTLSANTNVITPLVTSNTINNSDTVYSNVVSSSINVITPLLSSVTVNNSGTVRSDVLTANTNLITPLVSSTTVNNSGTAYTGTLSANTSVSAPLVSATTLSTPLVSSTTVNNSGTAYTGTLSANTNVITPRVTLSSLLEGNTASGFLNSLYAQSLVVGGNFTLTGTTTYAANTFILSQNVASAIDSFYNVDRGPAQTQASFRWTETPKTWQIKNVTSGSYYRVLTDEYLNDTVSSTSTTAVATANIANYLNTLGTLALNTALAAKTTFNGTSGVSYTSNTLSFSSNNGITIVPVGSNTFAVSTSQDLRTSGSPSFSTLSLSATPLGTGSGGSGQTSASGAFNTFITGAAGTGSSGQVLTTGGAGSYYWAAGGGGGGSVQPGTTINSSRLSYSGNNVQTIFTTPIFNQTNQLRAYINGVRQFESEYSANSAANTITFSTPPSVGDSVLIEVDGYIINPYYANNIPVTPTGTISGNTIQLAINTLESSKAPLVGATFIGDVTGISHGANTSNTSFATTQFVKNVLNQTSAVSGSTYAIDTSGNAGTVTNGVYTSGNQTIGGTKTFSSTIIGSINGNAATVTTIPSLSGDVTSSGNDLTLVNTGTNTGTFGNGTTVPIITVDSKGRITSISPVQITGGSAGTGSTTFNRTTTTATAGQTLISSIPHTTGFLQVFLNGMMLPANDYTSNAINSSIVITTPLRAGDIVDTFAYTTTVANNLSPGTTGGSSGTVLYQSAANTTSNTAVGTAGYLLTSQGTGQPTWTNPATLSVNIANTATSITGTTSNTQFFSVGVGTAASTANGEIRATNNITAYYTSDKKFKENVQDIPNALEKVDAIGGKLFDWTDEYIQEHGGEDGYFIQKSDFGVIAQDVQSVFPLATRKRTDGSLAVDYEKLCALAFAAIKELKSEVEVLKGQIK